MIGAPLKITTHEHEFGVADKLKSVPLSVCVSSTSAEPGPNRY